MEGGVGRRGHDGEGRSDEASCNRRSDVRLRVIVIVLVRELTTVDDYSPWTGDGVGRGCGRGAS